MDSLKFIDSVSTATTGCVSIVLDFGVEMVLLGNTSVQLTLLYNTLYNVSIVLLVHVNNSGCFL